MKPIKQIVAAIKSHILVSSGEDGLAVVLNCNNVPLEVIFSWGRDWEHASIVVQKRCPTWPELCFVKDFFWQSNECVIQYHPAETSYVNVHNYCLHLWRPQKEVIPMPPKDFV